MPVSARPAERKIFTELSGDHAGEPQRRAEPHRLSPQPVFGRLSAELRGVAPPALGARGRQRVRAHATQRKPLKRYGDLEVTACKPWATGEQYEPLKR